MTNGMNRNSGHPGNGGTDGQGGRAANVRDISEIQTAYIMRNFPDAAIYPPQVPVPGQQVAAAVDEFHRRFGFARDPRRIDGGVREILHDVRGLDF